MTEQGKKLLFVSLGCDKNRVDSERMLGLLAGQYELTDAEEEADIIIVNTCSFIQEATEESIATILEMADYRRQGRCRALLVTGCMPERYREEIRTEIPEVDALLGAHSYMQIREAIAAVEQGERPSYFMAPAAYRTKEPSRVLTTGGFFAYLKIAEGCSRHCTYCTIPSIRGPYRSVPMDDLIEEAKELAARGVRELILVAQDTARYGVDLYGEKRLPQLLHALCALEGLSWIRLLYVYPEEIDEALLAVMRQEKKICHYLDLPIQHAEDTILKRMGRRTTQADLRRILASIRAALPNVVLRTTLIAGFPGETEEEHAALLRFIQEERFERLGVFPYSAEEGTAAARMPQQLEQEEKQNRADILMRAQKEISAAYSRSRIGDVMEVLIEGEIPEEGVYVGRTYADAPEVDGLFFVHSSRVLHSGDLIRARIREAAEYDWIGDDLDVEIDEPSQ